LNVHELRFRCVSFPCVTASRSEHPSVINTFTQPMLER
jgi:hypothetical protein